MKLLTTITTRLRARSTQTGSSLIELLIAIMVVGVVVTGVAYALTQSVKNTAESRYRELATAMAQDSIDLFRREREAQGWRAFTSLFTTSQQTFCFNSFPTTIDAAVLTNRSGQCGPGNTFQASRTTFQREIEVYTDAPSETLTINVIMTWNVGSDDERSITITQILKERS